MANREYWEVAARLNRLYSKIFNGERPATPLHISHDDFCRLGDVKKLKSPRFIGVAAILLRDYRLILGRSDGFFLVVADDAFPKSTITTDAVTRELKRPAPPWPASMVSR